MRLPIISKILAPHPSLRSAEDIRKAKLFNILAVGTLPIGTLIYFIQHSLEFVGSYPIPFELAVLMTFGSLCYYLLGKSQYWRWGVYLQVTLCTLICTWSILFLAPKESASIFGYTIAILICGTFLSIKAINILGIVHGLIFISLLFIHPHAPSIVGAITTTVVIYIMIIFARYHQDSLEKKATKLREEQAIAHRAFIDEIFDGTAIQIGDSFHHVSPSFALKFGLKTDEILQYAPKDILPPNINHTQKIQSFSLLDEKKGLCYFQLLGYFIECI